MGINMKAHVFVRRSVSLIAAVDQLSGARNGLKNGELEDEEKMILFANVSIRSPFFSYYSVRMWGSR